MDASKLSNVDPGNKPQDGIVDVGAAARTVRVGSAAHLALAKPIEPGSDEHLAFAKSLPVRVPAEEKQNDDTEALTSEITIETPLPSNFNEAIDLVRKQRHAIERARSKRVPPGQIAAMCEALKRIEKHTSDMQQIPPAPHFTADTHAKIHLAKARRIEQTQARLNELAKANPAVAALIKAKQ